MHLILRATMRLWSLIGFLVLLTMPMAGSAQNFMPAFTEQMVDLEKCRQICDNKDTPIDPEVVLKALGFYYPKPKKDNWEDKKWVGGKAVRTDGATKFQYLVVLKQPVEVGTMCINPPNMLESLGSRNGGEVWYLKPGAPIPPDPNDPKQWVKVTFAPNQPFMRFYTFPDGTKTQAVLYTDERDLSTSTLVYWYFFKNRLASITPGATGSSEGGLSASDPQLLIRGEGWENVAEGSGAKRAPVSDKDPTWYTLSWDKPQTLSGFFICSNVKQMKVMSLNATVTGEPGVAPDTAWTPVTVKADRQTSHWFRDWAYYYSWFSFAPQITTRAVRFQITAADGDVAWIKGLGAFVMVQGDTVPTFTPLDGKAPYRIKYSLPVDGEATMVINGPDGHRVKNVQALVPSTAGPDQLSWDLKDETGQYVAPGTYHLKTIVAPPIQLRYQMTAYPNIETFWKDRTPWLTGHSGPNGWLSDHCQNWACATWDDKLYIGAPMAEAGVALIECDLDGKKIWGKHDFDPWTGVDSLAADQKGVYIISGTRIFRMNPADHKVQKIGSIKTDPNQRGWQSAITAWDGRLYIGYSANTVFDNVTNNKNLLDLNNCLPKPGPSLHRALRVSSTPPGVDNNPLQKKLFGNGNIYLESTQGTEREQYNIIAFTQPVGIGTLVFPYPEAADGQLRISVLKPAAPYPPRVKEEGDWYTLPDQGKPGQWACVAPPSNVTTRAICLTFIRPDNAPADKPWFGRLEGMKLLNRRFQGLAETAKISVNSGTVNANGEWDAKRTDPLGADKPGLYMMEWPQPQKISGLAIKEIDGARTEVDVWDGPAGVPVTIEGTKYWTNVATYTQKRRVGAYDKNADNYAARYMDGYVEFKRNGQTVQSTTRAIRLRIVEPWYDNAGGGCRRLDGALEHGKHISQTSIMNIDTRTCRVLGVQPMQYIGGEPKVDPTVYSRIEVYDGQNGTLIKTLPTQVGWGMGVDGKGNLFAIAKDHQSIIKVDKENGDAVTVIPDVKPSRMAVGQDGTFYLFMGGDENLIKVYSPAGKYLRTMGHPGGLEPGKWDPYRTGNIYMMCVDKNNSIWVPETEMNARRVLQYDGTTGKLKKEILGNTFYGGGGTLNRYDITRAYYGRTEFSLDYNTRVAGIRSMLAENVASEDLVAFKRNGFLYLVTTPLKLHDRQGRAVVYLYNEATQTVKPVAAFGNASGDGALRTSTIVSMLPTGDALKSYIYIWSDLNGNGTVEANEVKLEKKTPEDGNNFGLGPFDFEMGCTSNNGHYFVKEIFANGTPVYEKESAPLGAFLKLSDGNYFTLHSAYQPKGRTENYVVDPKGNKIWGYPASSGVSGLYLPPWEPGRVTNQFGIIGHEKTQKGDLGEFVVVSLNTGQWQIWTADGLLAGEILRHKYDPRSKFFNPEEAIPGMRLDPLTASQEHFHGFVTKNEANGKYYAVVGFNHISVVEVDGIEDFHRGDVEFTVTADDIAQAKAWEAKQVQRSIAARPLVLTATTQQAAPVIDGKKGATEWGASVSLDAQDRATLSVSYDAKNLYLCWTGKKMGPIKNSGDDYHRYFKTGACLDFYLGTDPNASANRAKPVKGDLRLLVTFANNKPQVVLYQPVFPGAKPDEHWRAFTVAAGETLFDRVALLPEATVAMTGKEDFTVEVAVPLQSLGLQITPGLRLKADWGVLSSPDGMEVKERVYWANKLATGTSDESSESRLEPGMWGYITFAQ